MTMRFTDILEEICPYPFYICRGAKLRRRASSVGVLTDPNLAKYQSLSSDDLRERLGEEHFRARAMDEKTFKLTLSFSIGLSILGLTTSSLVNTVSCALVQTALILILGAGTLNVLAAAFLALGALRTLPTYGYGTAFLLKARARADRERVLLADALLRQETMNQVRHLRNEAAYQGLRNGVVMVFAGFCVLVGALVHQYINSVAGSGW